MHNPLYFFDIHETEWLNGLSKWIYKATKNVWYDQLITINLMDEQQPSVEDNIDIDIYSEEDYLDQQMEL